jgi:Uma2 family endonuclease
MITDINQLDFNRHYTYADYLTWKFKERVELIKGKIFRMAPANSTNHQMILSNLICSFGKRSDRNEKIFIGPFDVRLPGDDESVNPNTVIQPDICVICDLTKLDSKGCNGSPDLIVEIVSKSSVKKDLHEKFDLYQEAGVQEYWVVQPGDRTINVFTLNEYGTYEISRPKTYGDQISSQILPGLTIELDDIFSNLLEEPDEGYGDEVERL